MRQKPCLNAEDVRAIVGAAREEAQRNGWAVTIAVVDDGGHPLHLERLDGARLGTIAVALGKARTAAFIHGPSGGLQARIKDNPAMLALDYMPLPGGLPLLCGGHCVGGIGVSGVAAEQDEQVGGAGLAVLARLWSGTPAGV
jgi:glc operon protein GlcG